MVWTIFVQFAMFHRISSACAASPEVPPMPHNERPDIAVLLEAAKCGNIEALSPLLNELRPALWKVAQHAIPQALRRKLDASDVVQEACVAVVQRFQTFRGDT